MQESANTQLLALQPDLCVLPVPCQSLLSFMSFDVHSAFTSIFIADAVYQSYLLCIVCYFGIH